MTLTRLERRLRAAEARARAASAALSHPALLRLRVRLRRHNAVFLAFLLGLGILLMILHWAGRPAQAASEERRQQAAAREAPPPDHGAPGAQAVR